MPRVLIPTSLSAPPPTPAAGARVRQWAGQTMGTTWSVSAVQAGGEDASIGDGIEAAIEAVLANVIAQMSNWSETSDLSRFNRAAADAWVTLPEDCFAVLQAALQVARDSGGAYDPSAGPLVDLWGFGPAGLAHARQTAPTPDDVARVRQPCGWQRIEVDVPNRRARQPGGLALDFCAIAKGFAVDAVSRHLDARGVTHHLVEIGGELRGQGLKPDGMPWWVELESPEANAHGAARTLVALLGLSIATSGDYRRYFEQDGRRFAHTIDPRTGYPAAHALASVTVIHRDCMLADALSTALTVLGPQAGMDFAQRHALAARFLVRTPRGFDELTSPAFAAMLS